MPVNEERKLIPFPTSSGIQTTGDQAAQATAAQTGTTFSIESIPRDRPILFTRDEAWAAISAIQDAREIIGQALDSLSTATVSNREAPYKALLQKYGEVKGLFESAYAYAQLGHETIFRVLSNANVANGLTSRVEIRETVTPAS